jgi:hypothetical protein
MQLALLVPAERPTLDETRPAPLREADVDDIEVSRHNSVGEDGTRLPRDLGTEVAIREVRQREHLHARRTGELRDVDRRRVERLVGSLLLLVGKGCLVDEHVGLTGGVEDYPRRAGVTGHDDLPALTRGAEHLARQHLAAVRGRDGLAGLKAAEERSLRNAERACGVDVEAPRPLALHERVPVRVHAVLHVESDDPVVATVECVTGPQLDEPEVVGQLAEDAA